MSITVQTTVDLSSDVETQQVCAFAAVDLGVGEQPRDDVKGFVSIGSPHAYRPLTFNGTADELRRLAKVLEDAAMEMERQHADAHADWDRRKHYEAAEAAAAPGRYPERTTEDTEAVQV